MCAGVEKRLEVFCTRCPCHLIMMVRAYAITKLTSKRSSVTFCRSISLDNVLRLRVGEGSRHLVFGSILRGDKLLPARDILRAVMSRNKMVRRKTRLAFVFLFCLLLLFLPLDSSFLFLLCRQWAKADRRTQDTTKRDVELRRGRKRSVIASHLLVYNLIRLTVRLSASLSYSFVAINFISVSAK